MFKTCTGCLPKQPVRHILPFRHAYLSSHYVLPELERAMEENIAEKREMMAKLKTQFKDRQLDGFRITRTSPIEGLRGMPLLISETSQISQSEGLIVRGFKIADVFKVLPKPKAEEHKSTMEAPYIEGLLWLLLTGKVPKLHEVVLLRDFLSSSVNKGVGDLPPWTAEILQSVRKPVDVMQSLQIGVLSLKPASFLIQGLQENVPRTDLWRLVLRDYLFLISMLPSIVHAITLNRRIGVHNTRPAVLEGSVITRLLSALSLEGDRALDVLRLFMILHCDHESGCASTHSAMIVNSALGDPFTSYAAALSALDGHLHGGANSACLEWLASLLEKTGGVAPSVEQVRQYALDTLAAGRVIPGFGHAVLRVEDPRFTIQHAYCNKYFHDRPLVRLIDNARNEVPKILGASGKVACPYPNVDLHSGAMLRAAHLDNARFYTPLFGISRCLGIASQAVIARALNLPIERPTSIQLAALMEDLA